MRDNAEHQTRIASVKETGEELPQEEWERFDAAVAEVKAERTERRLRDGSYRLPDEMTETSASRRC